MALNVEGREYEIRAAGSEQVSFVDINTISGEIVDLLVAMNNASFFVEDMAAAIVDKEIMERYYELVSKGKLQIFSDFISQNYEINFSLVHQYILENYFEHIGGSSVVHQILDSDQHLPHDIEILFTQYLIGEVESVNIVDS